MINKLRYLPNVITFGRIIAIFPLAWLMLHKEYKMALLIAFIAGLSDGLDGFLAKKFNWQGWLGGVLDPLADKFLMFSCYAVFALQGIIPIWLFSLVVLRDLVIIAGVSYYHFRIGKIKQAAPTFASKVNTVLQILLILVLLLSYSELLDLFVIHQPLMWAVGAFTLITGIQYVLMGLAMIQQHKKKEV